MLLAKNSKKKIPKRINQTNAEPHPAMAKTKISDFCYIGRLTTINGSERCCIHCLRSTQLSGSHLPAKSVGQFSNDTRLPKQHRPESIFATLFILQFFRRVILNNHQITSFIFIRSSNLICSSSEGEHNKQSSMAQQRPTAANPIRVILILSGPQIRWNGNKCILCLNFRVARVLIAPHILH